jgi:hypothetical protein
MHHLLKYFFILTVIVSGCTKKTTNLFEKTPDERLNEVLTGYQAKLVQEPGWKLFVYPQGLVSQGVEVGGLTYYMKFTNNNRVSMISDFRIDMAATAKESGYRLKAAQLPSLMFDTYSYIHVAADPDPNVSTSPATDAGFGWGTDFDFGIKETVPKDSIVLKGNYNNSEAVLIKVSQAEIDKAFNGGLAHIMQESVDYIETNPLLYFNSTDNEKISVSFNLYLYIINFTYLTTGDDLITLSAPFSHTTEGLHFKDTVTVGGYSFQDLFWDDVQKIFYIQAGSTRIDVINSAVPIFPFYKVIGKSITTINVPTTPLPGQSALYTTKYDEAKNNLLNSPYGLELGVMDYIFDDASKTMALRVIVQQNGNNYLLQYVYSYTMNTSGIASFTRQGSNGNGTLVEQEMSPLLDFIDNDLFKLDYYTGASPVLGQFTSQDRPLFFFTGNLQ